LGYTTTTAEGERRGSNEGEERRNRGGRDRGIETGQQPPLYNIKCCRFGFLDLPNTQIRYNNKSSSTFALRECVRECVCVT